MADESVVEEYEDEIDDLADTLWSRMKDGFSGSSFRMTALQPLVDDADVLMGELYNLTDGQVSFTQNYFTDLGGRSARAGGGNEDLTYNPTVAGWLRLGVVVKTDNRRHNREVGRTVRRGQRRRLSVAS